MGEITSELVIELQRLSLVAPERCRAALEAHAGDVEKALRALAAAGHLSHRAMAGLFQDHTDVCLLATFRSQMILLKGCDAKTRRKHWSTSDAKYEEMRAKLSVALGRLDPRPDFDPNTPLVMNPSPPAGVQGGTAPVRQRRIPRSITVAPLPKLKPVAGDWEGSDSCHPGQGSWIAVAPAPRPRLGHRQARSTFALSPSWTRRASCRHLPNKSPRMST